MNYDKLPTGEVIEYKFSQAKAGGSLPYLKKRGGGADEYIRSIKPVIFRRFVSRCTACLYRQEQQAKINKPPLS